MESNISEDKRFCLCGCGGIITGTTTRWIKAKGWKTREYLYGHNRKGKKHPNYIPKQGARHGMWKGGRRIDNHGYVLIRSPKHPKAHDHGLYMLEHILVMEKQLGRYLWNFEVVHHKNGNRQDNRIENLTLMTRAEHSSMHSKCRIRSRRSK